MLSDASVLQVKYVVFEDSLYFLKTLNIKTNLSKKQFNMTNNTTCFYKTGFYRKLVIGNGAESFGKFAIFPSVLNIFCLCCENTRK